MDAAIGKLLGQATEPSTMETAHGWYRLPGARLELRGSGFQIHLCNRLNCQPFHLFDPDGRRLADSYLLQPLKQFAEQAASDRAEFGQ
jgi:hypothetical protein